MKEQNKFYNLRNFVSQFAPLPYTLSLQNVNWLVFFKKKNRCIMIVYPSVTPQTQALMP